MPYTIYLAADPSEARSVAPDLSIDYRTHQIIFDPEAAQLHDLSFFYLLSDFYQNASFLENQVLSLRGEVEEARRRIHHPRATEPLSLLGKLCDQAIKRGLNLYAFGE